MSEKLVFKNMEAKILQYIVCLDTAVYLRTTEMRWEASPCLICALPRKDDLGHRRWDWKSGSQLAPHICPHAWAWAPGSNQHLPFLLPASQASHFPSLTVPCAEARVISLLVFGSVLCPYQLQLASSRFMFEHSKVQFCCPQLSATH